ncbi:hypothetical protein RHSIM_Rhsim05G0054100 [Rhododendron simsii]|uniref:DUF1279 domain-containing protein n=1 Tax=Rhododendron simsii TaxID=118357 RepID=A0A834LMF2_RHOSS|nr:hypothetical protein RHSIM_Rhsim05G0054100 [Rhododendron simsii]
MAGGRFRELLKKYGKVALGVHFSVSAASITGLYVAINNNVDVESMLAKVGMKGVEEKTVQKEEQSTIQNPPQSNLETSDGFVVEETAAAAVKKRNRTAELAASSGGALALAVLCNKALFPIRVPITIALTPPIARFLARRQIIKNNLSEVTRTLLVVATGVGSSEWGGGEVGSDLVRGLRAAEEVVVVKYCWGHLDSVGAEEGGAVAASEESDGDFGGVSD